MTTEASSTPPFDPQVLDLFVCPVTRSKLHLEGDQIVSEVGGLRYPIRDGIAVLLPDEATLPEGVASLDEFKQRFGIA